MCGFIQGHAWFYLGGHAWFYSGGGACVVLFGGHAWFYLGGHVWLLIGGMCGFSGGWGACVVALGGHAWLLQGGMHGFFDEIWSMSGRYASYWNAFLFMYVNEWPEKATAGMAFGGGNHCRLPF